MDIIERCEPDLDGKLAKPVFWGKVSGFTAQELRPDMFDECLKLIEKYLIPEEAMCVALDMKSDAVSSANLLASARNCMKDGTSIVVLKGEDYVEEEDDEEQSATSVPPTGDNGDNQDALDEGVGEIKGEEETDSVEKHDESGDAADLVEKAEGEKYEREGSDRSEQRDEEKQQADDDQGDDNTVLSSEEERWRKERRKRRHQRRKKRRKAEEKKLLKEQQSKAADEAAEAVEEAEPEEVEEEEGEQRVVAVMVARVVQRVQHMRSFSRIKVVEGDAYQKWLTLRCHLQKTANLFERYGVDTYYRVYHIVVHPDHRKKGVGSFLARLAALRLAALFAGQDGQATVCTAVAPSRASQRLLARQGFKPHTVVNYHEWKDEQGQAIITGAGTGNYSAVLAVYEVTPREPDEPLDVSPLVDRVEEVPEGPRPITAFPGREQGLSRPPKPECPPAQEEPPFGVAVGPRPPRALSEWRLDGQGGTCGTVGSQGVSGSGRSSSSQEGSSSSRGATGSSRNSSGNSSGTGGS